MDIRLVLKGIATQDNAGLVTRRKLADRLSENEKVHRVEDIIRDVVRVVKTPPPKPLTPTEAAKQLFDTQNAGFYPRLHYAPETYDAFHGFARELFDLLSFPTERTTYFCFTN